MEEKAGNTHTLKYLQVENT